MPWCPKCRNEYVAGVQKCADCGCDLVDSLKQAQHNIPICPKEVPQAEEEEGLESQTVPQEADLEELIKQQKQAAMFQGSHIYQKSSEKAEDFKSSAYVLLLVGIGGIVLLVLIVTGLLPIRLDGWNRYLTGGVMGTMFLLFIIMGILSLRSSKTLLGKAVREDELTREILNWCSKNLTAEAVDEMLTGEQDLPEEAKYFRRALYMKERISHQFLNLDENYLEQLVDDYYQEIYG